MGLIGVRGLSILNTQMFHRIQIMQETKAQELFRKCYEHSDAIHQGRQARVVMTELHLKFYNVEINEVLKIFSEALLILEGPAHPHDPHQVVWSTWCQRDGENYLISAKSKLVDNPNCEV